MRFSVIVNTLNRAKCLRVLLEALEHQTYPDFEVVVVNGPSTDDTEALLAEYAGRIRTATCPKANLSLSRNIGIAAAAGDVCAFIDDDGIPEPQWVADLAAGYTAADVAGVGGIVYDHTGYEIEYSCVICDRLARAVKHVTPPLSPYQLPKADPYLHLMGGNSSFRREKLREVGGFDEEIEYFLDEAELCLQMNNRGFRLVQSDRAVMLHKAAASHVRSPQRIIRRPFAVVKNKYYFVLQAARRGEVDLADALAEAKAWSDKFRRDGGHLRRADILSAADYEQYERDIDTAVRVGTERGMMGDRQNGVIPPVDPSAFRSFPTRRPAAGAMTVCFVSKNYPPEPLGGIGRFTHELARGMAADGHEVHVVALSPDHNRVDFEEGVWVHRMVPMADGPWDQTDGLTRGIHAWAAAAHAEVRRIHDGRKVDLVSAPVWDCEGLYIHLDDEISSVLSLHTTLKTAADLNPAMARQHGIREMVEMEKLVVRQAKHLTAPSRAILEKVQRDYAPAGAATVIYHGIPDKMADYHPRVPDGKVRVLCVGRLEHRKGTDIFLAAAAQLCPEFPDAEFVLVGNDTIRLPGENVTYRQAFERKYKGEKWAERVKFRGEVPEGQLYTEYAACDIFCLPARYESFGLVLIEAMMFAKPVVATAVGGMPEVVADAECGFLAYPDSPGSLAARLRPLLADSALRAEFGAAARERFEERFRLDEMVETTRRTYARMAA